MRGLCHRDSNWSRLNTRFKINNLKFFGSKVFPSCANQSLIHFEKVPSNSAASSCVSELIASLLIDHPDIDPEFSLPEPLSYSALMQKLEALNLVSPIAGTSTGGSTGTGSGSSSGSVNPSRPRKGQSSLSKAHQSKVHNLMSVRRYNIILCRYKPLLTSRTSPT